MTLIPSTADRSVNLPVSHGAVAQKTMPVVDRKRLPIEANVFAVNSEAYTFQDATVREWVEERLEGRVLNACAGKTRLSYDGEIVTNDLDEDIETDFNVNLKELHECDIGTFDTVVYDPPWSVFQVNDKYEGRGQDTIKQSTLMAQSIDTMLNHGGKVLGFGYTVDMIPSSFDYSLKEVAVFTIPGPGKDFLGSVHVKENRTLTEWSE